MALTAGALSKVLIGQSTAQLSSTAASGGTGPCTLVAGATGLGPLVASGLIPGTLYYFNAADKKAAEAKEKARRLKNANNIDHSSVEVAPVFTSMDQVERGKQLYGSN